MHSCSPWWAALGWGHLALCAEVCQVEELDPRASRCGCTGTVSVELATNSSNGECYTLAVQIVDIRSIRSQGGDQEEVDEVEDGGCPASKLSESTDMCHPLTTSLLPLPEYTDNRFPVSNPELLLPSLLGSSFVFLRVRVAALKRFSRQPIVFPEEAWPSPLNW